METETVSLGSSSRVIGENLESFKALVMAYSRRPKKNSLNFSRDMKIFYLNEDP